VAIAHECTGPAVLADPIEHYCEELDITELIINYESED
jgi:hypothetical protein